MEDYALVGHSGTGKSHHAPLLAYQHQIEYLIDDGLLIKGNQILAGRSAKRENPRLGAIKRALFSDPDHAAQIREKLAELKPERLLLLATSRRMAAAIAAKLGLPKPAHYIQIEDIATPEAIKTALTVRQKENRHVIPLPTFAVKKDFPGYIVAPLRSFFSFPAAHSEKVAVERSIVRPVYSSLGHFYIAEHVIESLVAHIVTRIPGVFKPLRVAIQTNERKVTLKVDLALILGEIPGGNLPLLLRHVQQVIKEKIEYLTGFYLDSVDITAKRLYLDAEEEPEAKEN